MLTMFAVLVAATIPDPSDFSAFGKLVVDAFQSRNWFLAASLVLIALVWAVRKYGKKAPGKLGVWLSWIDTDRGGVVAVFALAFLTALAAAFVGGAAISVELLVGAASVALGAIGGYAGLKKLLFPSGADKAQAVEVKAAVVTAQASSSPEAAAAALNEAIK